MSMGMVKGLVSYVLLWALLPALKNREIAKGYLEKAEKILGRALTEREQAYLLDVIEQEKSIEEFLRRLGFP